MQEGKGSKTTNKSQFDALVELMEKNIDIARGATNSVDKVLYRKKWKDVMEKLNSYGPPSRDVKGWEKVWRDFKTKTKRKVGHNKKEQNSTGGGLNKLMHISTLEESVINLLNFNSITTGGSTAIGLSDQIENEMNYVLDDIPIPSQAPSTAQHQMQTQSNIFNPSIEESSQQPTSNPIGKRNKREEREFYLRKQTDLLKNIGENTSQISKSLQEISYMNQQKLEAYKENLRMKNDYRKEKEKDRKIALNHQTEKLKYELEIIKMKRDLLNSQIE